MKFKLNNPPRVFTVGRNEKIDIKDCARIELGANEQVTFLTDKGAEYDVARTNWGFYATPSLNGRLTQFGLRAVLVKHPISNRFYIFLVESGKEEEFRRYIAAEGHEVVCWMDRDSELEKIEQRLNAKS